MMMKHTPGPWTLDRNSVLIPIESHSWAEAYAGTPANARLIAAAPDLYKALALAVRQNEHDMLMTGEELRQCRAALAKVGE